MPPSIIGEIQPTFEKILPFPSLVPIRHDIEHNHNIRERIQDRLLYLIYEHVEKFTTIWAIEHRCKSCNNMGCMRRSNPQLILILIAETSALACQMKFFQHVQKRIVGRAP